jgi:hypothetical protein
MTQCFIIILSGTSVNSTSEVRSAAMLLLTMPGKLKIQNWGSVQRHDQ